MIICNQTFILFTYGDMRLLNKISCEIQILNEKVGKLMIKNGELEEENKNLNVKVASLEGEIKGLNSVIEKLKEENQTLELWLDNKEKVNKSLREENEKLKKYYDRDKEELMESCYDLARENKKLKEELKWWKDLVHKAKEFEYDEDGMDYIWQNTKI